MKTPDLPEHARQRPATRGARRLAAAVAFATAAVVGPAAVPAGAAPQTVASAAGLPTAEEAELFHLINGVRIGVGVMHVPFWNPVLGEQAQGWSGWMASRGGLAHHPNLGAQASQVIPTWSATGEIVGRGPSVGAVLDAFWRSPGHRAQMLAPYVAMGVGVVGSGGELWVTVRFIR